MGSISVRRGIRWLPGQVSEPTSTIVLTSPQRRFVDLRIFDADETQSQSDLSRLEWGIAGTSSTTTREEDGKTITRGRWEHWIDSRSEDAPADEGDMFPISETLTLEKGRMMNPETGVETDYEEVWDDMTPGIVPGTEGVTCVVLRMEKGRDRGLMVVLGRHCQALVRTEEGVSAERWEYEGGWKRVVRTGEEVLCEDVLRKLPGLSVGQRHEVAGRAWDVVELA